jgi:ferredoxin-NADP reductase
MEHISKVESVKHVTHDVLQIITGRPANYNFIPGQATDVCINKDGWKNEMRPFTFTCLPSDNFLQFTIKTYPERKGVTNELLNLKKDDELILHDVFGDIHYKDEGIFIAGGAGVTPFISILRYLNSINKIGNNKLIFANKNKADIILEDEFKKLLGNNFINILSDEKTVEYANGYMTVDFLKKCIPDFNKYFYVCGPPPMMDAVEKQLEELNVKSDLIVKESF